MSVKIFISYTQADLARMETLKRILTENRFFETVIIGEVEYALKPLVEKVTDGIEKSDYIVPIITEDSRSAQWVNQEIGFAYALKKTILPIVQDDIVNSLKGFIHPNIDLPYRFKKGSPQATRASYRKVCTQLLNRLLSKHKLEPSYTYPEDIFPGEWKSAFKAHKLVGEEEPIEIREENKYYVKGKHHFDIEDYKLDLKAGTLHFVKVNVKNRQLRLVNQLRVRVIGRFYDGIETDELRKINFNIEYKILEKYEPEKMF